MVLLINTEEWNGTNWSEGTDLITGRYVGGSALGYLSSENALYFGGNKALVPSQLKQKNGMVVLVKKQMI